jgi:hypothetical protein
MEIITGHVDSSNFVVVLCIPPKLSQAILGDLI